MAAGSLTGPWPGLHRQSHESPELTVPDSKAEQPTRKPLLAQAHAGLVRALQVAAGTAAGSVKLEHSKRPRLARYLTQSKNFPVQPDFFLAADAAGGRLPTSLQVSSFLPISFFGDISEAWRLF